MQPQNENVYGIIPENVPPKFFAKHFKPYELARKDAAGKMVLEIGFGDGYGAAYLAAAAKKVIGVDPTIANIDHARKKYQFSNLEFQVGDATALKFDNECFDMVCSFQVIEHIPEDKLLPYLSEIKRVLKNTGKFYVSTLNLAYAMKSPLTYQKNLDHCKEFTLDELRDLLVQVFLDVQIYGLQLTLKHRFYQRLKRIGIFNFLPKAINPVVIFYNRITIKDFKVVPFNLEKAIDFICICGK
ncbi:MAG: class I SAM-dependent methyltransferase [Candidatus Omnitrophica bacterium]|jgi:SAM-dependent methyltransferase|nr:class I SAM-dependent methyltransferase [Candidatus Omnitrophota bacterium]